MLDSTPNIKIGFVFNYCRDVVAIRNFYTEFLGMKQISYQQKPEASWNWVVYDNDGIQFMFFQLKDRAPEILEGWGMLPGDGMGEQFHTSYSVTGYNELQFKALLARLKELKIPVQEELPSWRQDSYWGLNVKDPMGNTLELCWEPKEKPAQTAWV